MKGIILAGGTGSRLMPSTKVTNKHLLPVYDRPMIYYPLDTLGRAGIDEVLLVCGEGHAGDFLELLGDGSDIVQERKGEDIGFNFQGDITYRIQKGPKGIAHAIGLAEGFVEPDEKFVVILGDNIFDEGVSDKIRSFADSDFEAQIFLKDVEDPRRFANPQIQGDQIIDIVEKPNNPFNSYAVTGCYGFYNDEQNGLFRLIDRLEPSDRGEIEITDILNWYLERGELSYETLSTFWTDAGKPDSLLRASIYMSNR